MPWYYANNNHRLGPVSDSEFARLARDKVIVEDTLVWRHGMPDWKTYAEVVAALPPPEITALPPGVEEAVLTAEPRAERIETAPRLDYAGFWIRVCAKLVDLFILNLLVTMVAKWMGIWREPPNFETMNQVLQYWRDMNVVGLGRIALVVGLVYEWFFLWWLQATPGKLILGLKVVRADGARLGHLRIVSRYFAEMLNQLTLFIGYLVVAFDDEKRAMHDVMCGTRVVHKRRNR